MADLKKVADQSKFCFHKQTLTGDSDKHILNVGMDIGYGSLKVMSKYGLHKIQSLVIPFVRPLQAYETLESIYMGEYDIIYVENKGTSFERMWAVGKKALDTLDAGESYIDVDEYYNKKWYQNKEFQILFNVGLYIAGLKPDFTFDTDIEQSNICLGLPVQWVKYNKELKENLIGQKEFDILMKDGELHHVVYNIKEENLEVIPQHEGSLDSLLLDFNGHIVDKIDFAHQNVLLIDAGNRTVDAHLLLKNNKSKSKTWLDVSMFSVKNDVCEYIAEETNYEREIYEYQLDKYIVGQVPCTIKYGRKIIDFAEILQKGIDEKVAMLAKRVQMVYNLDDVDIILIAGGSGLCYFDRLKSAFDMCTVILAEDKNGPIAYDATYSNVIGYYKLLMYYDKAGVSDPALKKKLSPIIH